MPSSEAPRALHGRPQLLCSFTRLKELLCHSGGWRLQERLGTGRAEVGDGKFSSKGVAETRSRNDWSISSDEDARGTPLSILRAIMFPCAEGNVRLSLRTANMTLSKQKQHGVRSSSKSVASTIGGPGLESMLPDHLRVRFPELYETWGTAQNGDAAQ